MMIDSKNKVTELRFILLATSVNISGSERIPILFLKRAALQSSHYVDDMFGFLSIIIAKNVCNLLSKMTFPLKLKRMSCMTCSVCLSGVITTHNPRHTIHDTQSTTYNPRTYPQHMSTHSVTQYAVL